jgi:hypothetical protein
MISLSFILILNNRIIRFLIRHISIVVWLEFTWNTPNAFKISIKH